LKEASHTNHKRSKSLESILSTEYKYEHFVQFQLASKSTKIYSDPSLFSIIQINLVQRTEENLASSQSLCQLLYKIKPRFAGNSTYLERCSAELESAARFYLAGIWEQLSFLDTVYSGVGLAAGLLPIAANGRTLSHKIIVPIIRRPDTHTAFSLPPRQLDARQNTHRPRVLMRSK